MIRGNSKRWMNPGRAIRILAVSAILALSFFAQLADAQSGCRTGASPIANAYVRSNPMYALYFGDLSAYVRENNSHFVSNGDAIRCARALSAALMGAAIQNYDPDAMRRRDELNAELGAMGISPGNQGMNASATFYMMGQHISRLAAVLPEAAGGGQATGYLTQEQALAAQIFQMVLQDPYTKAIFAQLEPKIRAVAEVDYQLLVSIANGL